MHMYECMANVLNTCCKLEGTQQSTRTSTKTSGVFRGPLCEAPLGRTAVICVAILGLFLAPFRDKIAATSDQIRFLAKSALKCVCGRGSAQGRSQRGAWGA